MLETIANEPWETIVARDLFAPLSLKSGGFGAPAKNAESVDQPWGHRDNGSPVRPGPQADNVPAIGPAGTVHLSLPDFARYAQWHLRAAAPKPSLITPASLGRLHGRRPAGRLLRRLEPRHPSLGRRSGDHPHRQQHHVFRGSLACSGA